MKQPDTATPGRLVPLTEREHAPFFDAFERTQGVSLTEETYLERWKAFVSLLGPSDCASIAALGERGGK
jgi:hypothetical protein